MTISDPASWRAAGRRLDFRGHQIFFRDGGDGPPLLLIHGFPTSSWDWHALWPSLVSRYRLVAADMLGFGFSDKPRGHDYSILEQADLHEELLASLGIDSVDVLAHDYGDTVVQELLARQQEGRGRLQLRTACLLNGGIFPEAIRTRTIQRLLMSPLGALVGRLLDEQRFARSFRPIFGPASQATDEEIGEFWSLIEENGGPAVAHRVIRYMHERKRYRDRWVGVLRRATIPLRLIIGTHDPVSGPAMADRWRALLPQPDVILLEEVGHYPHLEAPDRTREAYLEFRETWTPSSG